MTLTMGARRGERHPHHRLTPAQAAEMRRLRDEHDWTYRRIALLFAVSPSTAYRAILGETYAEEAAG